MKNLEFLYSDKLNFNMLLDDPEYFENIKIYTWYAMIKKGLSPMDWFILSEGTKISFKVLKDSKAIKKEKEVLDAYIEKQIERFSKRGVLNGKTKM